MTHAIVGMNFWGPPLLTLDPPGGAGAFARAYDEAIRLSDGPRYRLRVVDGFPEFTPDLTLDCGWIVTTEIGVHASIEFGPKDDHIERTKPPPGFELATVIRGVPRQRSSIWPFLVSGDYEELRGLSISSLWRDRMRGLTLIIYRRQSRN